MKTMTEDLEDKVETLESENQELRERLENIESVIDTLPRGGKQFYRACAIALEQIWEVVFNDILKRDVPRGTDLRNLL